MCGICGFIDLKQRKRNTGDRGIVENMTRTLRHRGPDEWGCFIQGPAALGISRLSIIDLEGGMQPIFNEDRTIVLVCNGEIFNYIELRRDLQDRGHGFSTRTDVEVIIHLYEEYGPDCVRRLNGQFAFALFDFNTGSLFCARDHFGIAPFFYTKTRDHFIFASEIKAILEHPGVEREVDLTGLDQVLTFPGLIDPRTMFKNIKSLENGHYLLLDIDDPGGRVKDVEYWDLIYPGNGEARYRTDESYYKEKLDHLIKRSVNLRLRSDVPVGIYISGGLDSSLLVAKTMELTPDVSRFSFSIDFEEKDKSESFFQRLMADFARTRHTEQLFFYADISERLEQAVFHSEYPLKETYNTASLALSEAAHRKGIKVVLTGEGADEWFAGYPGYKFDRFRAMQAPTGDDSPGKQREREINLRLWDDEDFIFEAGLYETQKKKQRLYSRRINEKYRDIDALNFPVVKKERIANRHIVDKRSYLDYKLRLVSHLVSDHGDRMAYANSVEARYPFLDRELVEFAATIPPDLKLNQFQEKYILKKVAETSVPKDIIKREKFAFHAPGSPYLLKRNIEYVNDLLSYETIKREGYFNPDSVEELKQRYSQTGFRLNIPYDSDLLMIVLTFGVFLRQFKLS
jgi:asparagine synthase (glutamine-hydrolysing)